MFVYVPSHLLCAPICEVKKKRKKKIMRANGPLEIWDNFPLFSRIMIATITLMKFIVKFGKITLIFFVLQKCIIQFLDKLIKDMLLKYIIFILIGKIKTSCVKEKFLIIIDANNRVSLMAPFDLWVKGHKGEGTVSLLYASDASLYRKQSFVPYLLRHE